MIILWLCNCFAWKSRRIILVLNS